MLHTLDVVAGTLGNVIIARAVEVIKESVREGKGLSQPMARHKGFSSHGHPDGCCWRGDRRA